MVGGIEPDVVWVDVDVVLGNGRPRGAAIGALQQAQYAADDDVGLVSGVDFDQAEVIAIAVAHLVEALLVGADPSRVRRVDATRGGFSSAHGLGRPTIHLRPDDGRVEHLAGWRHRGSRRGLLDRGRHRPPAGRERRRRYPSGTRCL